MNRETSAVAEARAGQATKDTKKYEVNILNFLGDDGSLFFQS
jgi:hypothetical protein